MFEQDKKTFLKKKDKSKKGKVDENISELVDLINKHPNYYTTSSCSGRIVLIERKSHKKSETNWLFVSHDAVDFIDLWKILDNVPKNPVWFRFEPMILHVACRDIESAEKLVKVARPIGFRRTGIHGVSKKVLVEIGGTDYIDTILGWRGDLVADGDYIKILISEANKKMTRNLKKIRKLEKVFKDSEKERKKAEKKSTKKKKSSD